MKIIRHIFVLFSLGLLAACTSMAPPTEPLNQHLSWSDREHKLQNLRAYRLEGRLAVLTPNHADSASFIWQQNDQHFDLSLYGPLGAGSIQLSGQPGRISLTRTNGHKIIASNPEQLLQQQTGWNLPISELVYWIRGMPAPKSPAHFQFDAYHHLTVLQQAGWTIHYRSYTAAHAIDLPSQILAERGGVRVKLAIHQWSVGIL